MRKEELNAYCEKWHALESAEIIEILKSSPQGISDGEAEKRIRELGYNRLPEKKPPTVLQIFISQFKNPLIYILLTAVVVSVVLKEYTDAVFILVVLTINAIIGTLQEAKAVKSAAALQQMLHIISTVKRNGKNIRTDAENLVPGDVIVVESGNRIPADCRIIESNLLFSDESLLTGESIQVAKSADVLKESTLMSDRKNMLYAGSSIVSGRGLAIVTSTGTDTQVGKIAKAITGAETVKAPLVIRMEKFARQVSYAILGAIVILSIIGIYNGIAYREIFFLTVALAVSAIPEGLPVAVTVTLAIGTGRMAKRNVIIRKLTAVEGLGSCTFIASDKTGTLTVNSQTVKKIVSPEGEVFEVTGEGYNPTGEVLNASGAAVSGTDADYVATFAFCGSICNEAEFTLKDGAWNHNGDAMDIALLVMSHKVQNMPKLADAKVYHTIAFEPEHKYAAVFYTLNGKHYVAVKGAYEVVADMCANSFSGHEFSPEMGDPQVEMLTRKGFRVLAFAYGEVNADTPPGKEALKGLFYLGLAGFIDPLRPEAHDAVNRCRKAGVEVAMVTGDHPQTALSISKSLGIAENESQVLTGKDLEKLGDPLSEEYAAKVAQCRVFARVSPLQKMHITDALKRKGHFVAVTGDGVNDVPALKSAHIGVAMGSGTDLAKETASIIVTDDNFSSIVKGIEGGRVAFDNIRKVVYLLVSTGVAEILIFFLALSSGMPIPLTAIQLLWLNLVTNGIQDVALAMEGAEPETMLRKPRKPGEGIFNRLMIQQTVVSGAVMGGTAFVLWYLLIEAGSPEIHARTLVLMYMVLVQNVQAFNCRSELVSVFKIPLKRNWAIVFGVLGAQTIHIVAVSIPFMQNLLESDRVSLAEWGWLFGLALMLLPVMEIFKFIKKRAMRI